MIRHFPQVQSKSFFPSICSVNLVNRHARRGPKGNRYCKPCVSPRLIYGAFDRGADIGHDCRTLTEYLFVYACLPALLACPARGRLRPQWMRVNDRRVREGETLEIIKKVSSRSPLNNPKRGDVCTYFTTISSNDGLLASASQTRRASHIIFLPLILQSVSLVCYVLSTCVHICYYITTFTCTRAIRTLQIARTPVRYTWIIFIMNTLSINKIIEFYIYRVTVVYCLYCVYYALR